MNLNFDVFLCHNDRDKPHVESLYFRLKESGINPFLDKYCHLAGRSCLPGIESSFKASSSCAVFFGPHGIGDIQQIELEMAVVRKAKEKNFPVIPVLLPGSSSGNLPLYIKLNTWVDFRGGIDNDEEFKRLIAGIKGDMNLLTENIIENLSAFLATSKRSIITMPDQPPDDIKKALQQASRPLLRWPTTLADGRWINREEFKRIRVKIEASSTSTTLLLGSPGSGKSALLVRIAQDLLESGIAVLAIKADLIPSNVKTMEQLKTYLELPGEPAFCIEVLAKLEKVALIIDQLDALADMVDLHSHRLGLLLNLIRNVSTLPNVHIITSCRTFEHMHDPRLRNLDAESINMELPSKEDVEVVLSEKGIQTTGWPKDFIEILQTPQYLKIFLEFNRGTTEPEIFQSSHAMLNKLWQEHIESAGNVCIELVDATTTTMAEREELWLPTVKFQDCMTILQRLKAAGILTFDEIGHRVGFSHQTLFEYARSRAFVRMEGSLSDYVLQRQNGMFVRPQLWNALNYLRSADQASYKREVSILLRNDELRLHIRILIIEFLSQLSSPQEFEANWLLPYLEQPEFRHRILSCMSGSKGWFDIIADTLLPAYMRLPSDQAISVVALLQNALIFAKDKTLNLIEKFWLQTPDKDNLTLLVFDYLKTWDEKALNMACLIFSRADTHLHWIQSIVTLISEHAPQLAPRLLKVYLDRLLEKAHLEAAKELPPMPANASEEEQMLLIYEKNKAYKQLLEANRDFYELSSVAEAAPSEFLHSIWPWFIDVLTLIVNEPHHILIGYRDDHCLATDLDGDVDSIREYPLISSIETAVKSFASQDSKAFVEFYEKWKNADFLVIQRLLARGLARLSDSHPYKILEFLLEDKRRLILGGYQDKHSDTKALITLLVPKLDRESLIKLETALCDFNMYNEDEPNIKLDRLKYNRQHRLRLLRAFPLEYMSEKTRRLLAEEERAFPNMDDRDVRFSGVHWIGSPMSVEQMTKASDEEIIGLFNLLGNASDRHPKDWLKGGTVQASQAFQEFAKEHPDRVISIIFKMDSNAHNMPVSYAIEGLGNSNLSTAELFNVISALVKAGFDSDDFHFYAASAIGSRINSNTPLPEDFFEILRGWLISWTPPVQTSTTEEQADGKSVIWQSHRMIMLPHGNYPILETLSRACLLPKPPLTDRWLSILEEHVLQNEDPEVWKVLSIYWLPNLAFADKNRSEHFLDALFSKYPQVINSDEGAALIVQTQSWVSESFVSKWLNQLKDSDWKLGAQAYAEIILLRHAWFPECSWAKEAINDIFSIKHEESKKKVDLLVGAAYTAVELWSEPQHRILGTEFLLRLIPTSEDRVRMAVSHIFGRENTLFYDDNMKRILDSLCTYPEVLANDRTGYLIEALENMVIIDPDRVYQICSAIVDKLGKKLTNIAQSSAIWSENLINIALALNRLDMPHRERGLELFEKLLNLGVWRVRETLLELDRRLVPNLAARPSRRRRRRGK